MRDVASVRDSGFEKAVRSMSSYQGRRRVKARRVESVRRVRKERRAGVAERAEDHAPLLLVEDEGGSDEIGRVWEDDDEDILCQCVKDEGWFWKYVVLS